MIRLHVRDPSSLRSLRPLVVQIKLWRCQQGSLGDAAVPLPCVLEQLQPGAGPIRLQSEVLGIPAVTPQHLMFNSLITCCPCFALPKLTSTPDNAEIVQRQASMLLASAGLLTLPGLIASGSKRSPVSHMPLSKCHGVQTCLSGQVFVVSSNLRTRDFAMSGSSAQGEA